MSERVFDTLPVLVNETGYSVNFGPNGYQPGWVYRYDHQNIEVHALNKDGADLLGHLSVEMLLNNPRTEATFASVQSARFAERDVLIIAVNDNINESAYIYAYNPYSGISEHIVTLEGVSVTCFCVTDAFKLIQKNENGKAELMTFRLIIVGTSAGKLYRYFIPTYKDPFKPDFLGQKLRFPLEPNQEITKVFCYTKPIEEEGEIDNTICLAWTTGNNRVVVATYYFGLEAEDDEFHVVKQPRIEGQGDIVSILLLPTPDHATSNSGSERYIKGGVKREWVCIVGHNGSPKRNIPRPSVNISCVCPTDQSWKVHMVSDSLTPSRYAGIAGYLADMTILKENDQYFLYLAFNFKFSGRLSSLGTAGELFVDKIHFEDRWSLERVAACNVTSYVTFGSLKVLPTRTMLDVLLLCRDKVSNIRIDSDKLPPSVIKLAEDYIEDIETRIEEVFAMLPDFSRFAENIDVTASVRNLPDHMLIIDRLLDFADVQVKQVYPPTDMDGLKELIRGIYHCDLDLFKKDCIVYYLLLDSKDNAVINSFVEKFMIPRHYQQITLAYWFLDHRDYANAVPLLSQPTVRVDWPEAIVEAFMAGNQPEMAWRFITHTGWNPNEAKQINLKFQVIMRVNLPEALLFQRKYARDEVNNEGQLFTQLLEFCFVESKSGEALKELMSLQLAAWEEDLLINYCTEAHLSVCIDFMITYFVYRARYMEAIRFNETVLCRRDPRIPEDELDERREAIIENILLVLPQFQRKIIESTERRNTIAWPQVVRKPFAEGSLSGKDATAAEESLEHAYLTRGTIPSIHPSASMRTEQSDPNLRPFSATMIRLRRAKAEAKAKEDATPKPDINSMFISPLTDQISYQTGDMLYASRPVPDSSAPDQISHDTTTSSPTTSGQITPQVTNDSGTVVHTERVSAAQPSTPGNDVAQRFIDRTRRGAYTDPPLHANSGLTPIIDVKRPTSPLPTYNAIDSLHLNSTEQTTRLMRSAHATLNIQPGTPASPLPTELLASGNISARKSLKSTPVLAHISPSSRVPGSATSASAIPASINSPARINKDSMVPNLARDPLLPPRAPPTQNLVATPEPEIVVPISGRKRITGESGRRTLVFDNDNNAEITPAMRRMAREAAARIVSPTLSKPESATPQSGAKLSSHEDIINNTPGAFRTGITSDSTMEETVGEEGGPSTPVPRKKRAVMASKAESSGNATQSSAPGSNLPGNLADEPVAPTTPSRSVRRSTRLIPTRKTPPTTRAAAAAAAAAQQSATKTKSTRAKRNQAAAEIPATPTRMTRARHRAEMAASSVDPAANDIEAQKLHSDREQASNRSTRMQTRSTRRGTHR